MAKAEAVKTDVEVPVEEKKKKVKRLSKTIEGKILTIVEGVTGTVLKFDFEKLPAAIQDSFGCFGMSHKLGDAAAGKKGQEAIDSINKVFEGLMAGNWSVRAPAAAKITKKGIMEKFDAMPEGKEKEIAKGLLTSLGLLG